MKTALQHEKRQRQAVASVGNAAQLTEALAGLREAGINAADVSLLIERTRLTDFLNGPVGHGDGDDLLGALLREREAVDKAGRYVAIGPFAKLLGRVEADSLPDLASLQGVGLALRHAEYLQQQVETGKALLWVLVQDGEEEGRICRALLDHSDGQVQVHDLPITPRRGPPHHGPA
jgi:hypothetical protein